MELQLASPNRIINDRFKRYWIISPIERAQLQRFRLKGGERPNSISLGDWSGPMKMHWLHQLGCCLCAAGAPNRKIARMIEMTESRASIFLSSSLARIYVDDLLRQHGREAIRGWAIAWGYWSPDR